MARLFGLLPAIAMMMQAMEASMASQARLRSSGTELARIFTRWRWRLAISVRVEKISTLARLEGDASGSSFQPSCFDAKIEIEHDCSEARTCGCMSSVLSIQIVNGGEIVRTRLDEVSNVFEREAVTFNVTLCAPEAVTGKVTETFHVGLMTSLSRSEGGRPVSWTCANISSSGQVGDCEIEKSSKESSTVVVTGISKGNESCANPEAASNLLKDARSHMQAGRFSSALLSLKQILEDERSEMKEYKVQAARLRNSLLPPLLLSHRCCDSLNPHCASLDKSLLFATDSWVEEDIIKIVGRDQCSGLFVEIGAGDGVSNSPTLFLEKFMGWKGALFEAEQEELVSCHSDDDEQDDEENFKLLESNGRSAAKYKDGFRTSGGGVFDARDAIKKMFDSSKDGIQIIFLNLAGELQLEALKAMKLEPSAGEEGMLVPYTYLLAVEHDGTIHEEAKSLLAAKDYAWRAGAGEEGKGRRYDIYHYTFPSHLMEAMMNQAASQASSAS
ncbi:hypothetical protein GUITHDRAFT_114843 [Guillardia theta CCMP2712]|uniref:Uncharacterized protein n=1 Tax=Guillardia theta (strain CCMP2712) TaxID=905079 RepID=L1IRU6_GUITC|nr:hypothetical protein GUITHDRAFT_114843 [Guillardia theta CCMP2712]EKX38963.1 hypothetical protein GUITHDRAFT_114843 [Guillardia theta CCMP2712]|eukprot:XP_005825943.1 hypothetical protein GUITHDRAFT_114843 [Guillardia theta CCMP2712]